MDGQVSQTSGPMFEVWLLVCRSCLNGDLKQMLVKVARLCACVSSTVISLQQYLSKWRPETIAGT